MTIKKGLKRIWIVISMVVVVPIAIATINDADGWVIMLYAGIPALAVWWGLYWSICGFFGDEKKDDDNNEMG